MATEASPSRGLRILLGAAGAVVALAGIKAASSIVGPIFLALTLVIAVQPLRGWLTRKRAPGWLVVAVPLLTVVLVLLALLGSLTIAVAELTTTLPDYSAQFDDLIDSVSALLAQWGVSGQQIQNALGDLDPANFIGVLQGFLSGLLSVSSAILLILVVLFTMSLDAAALGRSIGALAPGRPELVNALSRFVRNTCRYLVVSSIFGLIVAALDAGALWVLGVPLPLLWGLLAFVTNYIPNVGFVIGLVPPALLALLDGGVRTMLLVIVAYSVINFVLQSLVQPKYLGQAVGLSATLTMISLLLWGWVLGPLGAVLAIPLSSLVKALLVDSDPANRWIAAIMGDAEAADTLRTVPTSAPPPEKGRPAPAS
ncbi:MAG: AI-2E family transporter [Streptosporangiales bacterium]|nr:AI-2E family transporter [Streptosporangiales bacterium]